MYGALRTVVPYIRPSYYFFVFYIVTHCSMYVQVQVQVQHAYLVRPLQLDR